MIRSYVGHSYRWRWLTALLIVVSVNSNAGRAVRANDPAALAEKPWATIWMSSLARMLATCHFIFDSADRPELGESLEDRLGSYRQFRGIDRSRALGMMWTWEPTEPPAIIFLPIQDIEELMKTATFDVVGFHKVAENRYEIERPGSPYHVLLRSGYAMFGENVEAMQALRETPDRLTKALREKYDVVLSADLRQVPRSSKELWIESLRSQIDPWLQPQDDEPVETATVRRVIGTALLNVARRLILDVSSLTIGGRLDAEKKQLSVEFTIEGESGSELAAALNRLVARRSEFSALMNRDATAGLTINWPLHNAAKSLLGQIIDEEWKGSRLDAGVQIVGRQWGDASVISGLRGPEATALNAAIPHLIVRLEKSGQFAAVCENADVHRGVVFHSLVPRQIPELLGQIVGPEVEILVGQGKQTIWLAAGNPETLLERLQGAIDAVEDADASDRTISLLQGRIAAERLPIVANQDALPSADTINKSDSDDVRLSVEPIRDGLKIRFVAGERILRMIGQNWARQVDDMNAPDGT